MHGGRGEALKRGGELEEEVDKGNNEDSINPIMMEGDQIK
jgi:hypothetical protein